MAAGEAYRWPEGPPTAGKPRTLYDPVRRWGIGDALMGLGVGLAASTVLSLGALLWSVYLSGQWQDILTDPTILTEQITNPIVLLASLAGLWGGLILGPLWASHTKGQRSLRKDFGLSVTRRDVLLGISIGVAVRAAEILILLALPNSDAVEAADNTQILEQSTLIGTILIGLAVAAGAPLFEEIYFRGLLLHSLLKAGIPALGSVLISSLLFGMMHLSGTGGISPVLMIYTGLIGALLAVLTLKTGRLGAALTAHATFNTTAVALALLAS